MKRTPTSVRLTEHQDAFILRKAQEFGCSRSMLIKAIIYAYHQNHQRGGHLVKEVAEIIEAMRQ
jgi:hypothetical protein